MKTFSLILLGMMMIALLGGTQDSKRVGEAYPLTICPVSKRPLGENPVVVILEDMPESSMNGREVKFCCGGCSGRFMSDKTGNMNKLDEVIVKDQLKVYPVTNCIVMPEDELADPRSPEAMEDKNVIIGNRLYRFCCKGCIRKFKKDPAKYNAELDKLVIKQQAADYPIDVLRDQRPTPWRFPQRTGGRQSPGQDLLWWMQQEGQGQPDRHHRDDRQGSTGEEHQDRPLKSGYRWDQTMMKSPVHRTGLFSCVKVFLRRLNPREWRRRAQGHGPGSRVGVDDARGA